MEGHHICGLNFYLKSGCLLKCLGSASTSSVKRCSISYFFIVGVHEEGEEEARGVQFYKQDDEPYCLGCWLELFAKRCQACTKPLAPNTQYVEYEDKFWHKECFTCDACELELAGGVKFVNRYGDRFCLDCK